jgi:hypothetical protein
MARLKTKLAIEDSLINLEIIEFKLQCCGTN